jgi:carbon-monoxide dehydrogenase small subunit
MIYEVLSMNSQHLLSIQFQINGKTVSTNARPNQTLLELLRDDLHQWDVKNGCSKGDCGSCTVLVDGVTRLACLVLAAQVQGTTVLTAQGLGDAEHLHHLQKSFISNGAIQCGFCTPGMLITAKALLDKHPHPTRHEIREAISGNLCRCTGYQKIIDAIESASQVEQTPFQNTGTSA